jgi:cytoskeleton protein RodZ
MTKVTHLTLDEEGGLNRRRIHLREISGDADAPLETVGQDLRAARLRRGDDLASVSRALKIRKDHLEALEEDRLDALPGRTYAVGFVRTYADYLGLDALQYVERFKAEIAGRETGPSPVAGLPAQEEERKLPHGWMIIAIIIAGLVLFGIYHLAVSADRMLREPVAPVPAAIAAKPKQTVHFQKPLPAQQHAQAAPATEVAGKSAPLIAPVKPAEQPAQVTAAPQPAAQSATPAQAGAQTVAAQTEATTPAPPHAPQIFGQENANPRVILHVLQVTRVLVQGPDGKIYINRTLHPGDSYRVPDLVGLTLTTPDGGAVQIELDGQMMGTAGTPSEIVEAMPLDPQAVVDRTN